MTTDDQKNSEDALDQAAYETLQNYIGPIDPGMEALRRLVLRNTHIGQQRPHPPRGLKIDPNGNVLTWETPSDTRGITHFNVYVDDDKTLFRQVPFKQLAMTDQVKGTRFYVTALNFFNGMESSPAVLDNGVPVILNYARALHIKGSMAIIDIDGDTGLLTVTNLAGTVQTVINAAGVVVQAVPTHNPSVSIGTNFINLFNSAGHLVLQLQPVTDGAALSIRDAAGTDVLVDVRALAGGGSLSVNSTSGVTQIALNASVPSVTIGPSGSSQVQVLGTVVNMLNAGGVVQIALDSTVPGISVGAVGAAESIIQSASIRCQNAGNTRFVVISSAGSVTGQDLGGTTFSISGGGGISGSDPIGAWALSGTSGVSGTDATGAWSFNGADLRYAGVKTLGHRMTGWSAPTGTLSRATFDQSTVTLAGLAQRVAALETDLISQGEIGA
jgi:hypothetical protein